MLDKFKMYLKYFWFCWTSRFILEDLDIFMKLPEDEGKKFNLEIRNVRRKIRSLARNTNEIGPSKSLYLNLMLFETFNTQDEDSFSDSLRFPFVLLAVWAITKNKYETIEANLEEAEVEDTSTIEE